MSFTVNNIVNALPGKMGNRQDILNPADGSRTVDAIFQTIHQLSESYEFEELKYMTPIPPASPLVMTAQQPLISIASLLATAAANTNFPQFNNQNLTDLTDIYTFWIWFSGGVNNAGRALEYRRKPTVDMQSFGITSSTQGIVGTAPPVWYTRFGNFLQVGPAPDQNYSFFVALKIRHPFNITGQFTPAIITATIAGGVVNALTVQQGGSGYLPSVANIPLVFTISPNGSVATGTATTNPSGVITAAAIAGGGSGYTIAPNVATAVLASQQVFMPDSWREIVEWVSVRKLSLNIGASEYVILAENELKSRGINLGEKVESQMERDEKHNTRSLSLRVGRYTYA